MCRLKAVYTLLIAVGLATDCADEQATEPRAPLGPSLQFSTNGGVIGTESRIGAARAFQDRPDISGDWTIWVDHQANGAIFVHDLATGVETQVTTAPARAVYVDISGDRVVWADDRNGPSNLVIYLRDLSDPTGTEIRITTDAADPVNIPGRGPAISGDRIVWTDRRNGNDDIYMFDLSTGEETQMTNLPSVQDRPAISGDRIVWADSRNGDFDIYLRDLSDPTRAETRITTDPAHQYAPAISGDRIVWTDSRHRTGEGVLGPTDVDIYLYDLSTGQETRITSDAAAPDADGGRGPVISGDRIVWADFRSGNFDIHLLDIADPLGTETQITDEPENQLHPALSGDRIVWEDHRHGGGDIYLFEIGVVSAPLTITAPPDITVPSAPSNCFGTIADLGTPVVSDPEATVTATGRSANDAYHTGTATITWTATDESGRSASATQQITVLDLRGPFLFLPFPVDHRSANTDPGRATATLDPGTPSALDPCSPPASLVGVRSDGAAVTDPYPVGTTEVTWVATDAVGNETRRVETITVRDNEPPTLTGAADITLDATSPAGAVVQYILTARDNVDGGLAVACAPASGSTFAIGATSVHCSATDAAGNPGSASFQVSVLGAAEQIEQVDADLEAIVAENPATPAGDKAEDALPKVQAAEQKLAQTPPDRQGALGELEGAVGDLEAAVKDGVLSAADGNALMLEIVGAARLLAEQAIAEAEARGGDADKIAEARRALAQGDAKRDASQFKDAVARYKDAVAKAEGA